MKEKKIYSVRTDRFASVKPTIDCCIGSIELASNASSRISSRFKFAQKLGPVYFLV